MSDAISKDKLIDFFNAAAIGYATMKDVENHERCIKIVDMLKSDTFDFND
jgi:uncharacterized protein (UPF0262 family)